ncbi:ROK family transcriptional regulator [Falsiroseomonas sp.]|uniref:ROK family transcriptional regulator n=1 Tax=Falsiroseomonas sp. TaxID=2870721 RepID=UPI003F70F1C1
MKTADPELMRAINRYHVIDTIRRDGPIARVEIAARTELSPASVSAITAQLIEEGLIDIHHVPPGGDAVRGRPRVLLGLNSSAYHVVGVKLTAYRIGIAVTDARGGSRASLVLPVRVARQPPEVVADLVEDGVRRCVADAGLEMARISGVGVGLPGVIDGIAGISHWSPVLGGASVPFAAAVADRLGVPVLLENDANLVAVAEHWFGLGRDQAAFAVVTVENTIGLGLIVDGKLYRGAHGIGPALGHTRMQPGGLPCRCGLRGCLDAYASDWGLLRQAEEAGLLPAGDDAPERIAGLAQRALEGEEAPAALFRQAGAAIGVAVANLVNLLNPPRVILTGEGLRAGALLRDPLFAAVAENVLPTLREGTEILLHSWGDEMWARGAATIVLRRIYEAPWNASA